MMKRLLGRWMWTAIAVLLAALIGYGFLPQPIPVDMAQPVRGTLEITVDDDGETQIREKYVISAPVTGKMLRVRLDAGDSVHSGETQLAQIKPSDPELLDVRTQAETEARVRAAQATLMQAGANVTRAEEALKLAERDFERAKALLKQKAISSSEFDSLQHRTRMALADLRSAESAAQVASYEMDQAEAALRYTQSSDEDDFGQTTFTLVSPIDGTVLNVLHEDSRVVTAGTPLMELGDPQDMEIKVDVLSGEAVQIRPGDRVHIEHWGGDQPLRGTVRLVEPSAFLKISALGVEEKRVNVIVDFDTPWDQRSTLGDGFRVEARIVVDQTDEDALKIPAGALFRQDDRWYVFRVVDGTAVRTPVDVGLSNGLETEIRSGLTSGDVVIRHPPDSIDDGTRVRPL